MRGVRLSQLVFAVTLVALGAIGLVKGDFVQTWQPVPKFVPARTAVAYLCALVLLAAGLGLLWRRTAALAARALLGYLALWFLLVRLPYTLLAFGVGAWWSDSQAAVMLAAAWVLSVGLASDLDRRRFAFVAGDGGLRVARVLYGLALIPFGLAHFLYLGNTAPVVPGWLLFPVFWSYFTGSAFIAAGVAVVVGVLARLAAALAALQIWMFLVLVWLPVLAKGNISPFNWAELVTTWVIGAGAWVVADSYRGRPWLAVRAA